MPCRLGIAAAAALLLVSTASAMASTFTVDFQQQGNNVVATGSGSLDLSGLTEMTVSGTGAGVNPTNGYISLGTPTAEDQHYTGISAIAGAFSSGSFTAATSSSGISVALFGTNLYVPQGYTSGTAFSDGAEWDNTTIAGLGLVAGTYTSTWSGGTIVLNVGNAVPEPSALALLALPSVLLFGLRRSRRSKRA